MYIKNLRLIHMKNEDERRRSGDRKGERLEDGSRKLHGRYPDVGRNTINKTKTSTVLGNY